MTVLPLPVHSLLSEGVILYALITGASGGIGRDMAIMLSKKGYDLILVARNKEKLENLSSKLPTESIVIPADLSDEKQCYELYEKCKDKDIEILINNAGFGVFGDFSETSPEKEVEMINLNIKALHILMKLFLRDFKKKDRGYILNVSSMAGLMVGGPMMAGYYATKAYVSSLTRSVYEELRQEGSGVSVSMLCPGPVDTDFNARAGLDRFAAPSLPSKYVAAYALRGMFDKRLTIIPGVPMKMGVMGAKLLPEKTMLRISAKIQQGKKS